MDHVCGAAEDDCVVSVGAVYFLDRPGLGWVSVVGQSGGNLVGNPAGGAMPGGIGDEDVHDVSLLGCLGVCRTERSPSATRRAPQAAGWGFRRAGGPWQRARVTLRW